ncbi:MAG: restriction endonuclease [Negativicutes bacterium]
MPALNFKEIPPANIASGEQDKFELFARDFFNSMGLKIVSGPDRGQDAGRDIILSEIRKGIVGENEFKWLVSCKHKAHSGQSVVENDELNISDRVRVHGVNGFIGFYSTLPSAGLARRLAAMKSAFESILFDAESIEEALLQTPEGREIAKRYMPISYAEWGHHTRLPSQLLDEYHPLKCCHCGKDLLVEREGNIVFVEDRSGDKEIIRDVYWACKGECDRMTGQLYAPWMTCWEDIKDLTVPTEFLRWNIAIMNRLREHDDTYDDQAFEKLKKFLISLSQLVLRNPSDEQRERFRELSMIHGITGGI